MVKLLISYQDLRKIPYIFRTRRTDKGLVHIICFVNHGRIDYQYTECDKGITVLIEDEALLLYIKGLLA